MHGLRWAYARRRFLKEVGVECAAVGGPGYADMDGTTRAAARRATAAVAAEMGVVHAVVREVFLGFSDWGRRCRAGDADGGRGAPTGVAERA